MHKSRVLIGACFVRNSGAHSARTHAKLARRMTGTIIRYFVIYYNAITVHERNKRILRTSSVLTFPKPRESCDLSSATGDTIFRILFPSCFFRSLFSVHAHSTTFAYVSCVFLISIFCLENCQKNGKKLFFLFFPSKKKGRGSRFPFTVFIFLMEN